MVPDPRYSRDTTLSHLHPAFRGRLEALLWDLGAQSLPFLLFEGFRSPVRQAYLYGKGRTDKTGPRVTSAKAWASFHQYGLAADLVLFEDGKWSWDTSGIRNDWWRRMHQLARQRGLVPLAFERPHVELRGQLLEQLLLGYYPPGGDEAWTEHLCQEILEWCIAGKAGAPPPPTRMVKKDDYAG